MPKCEAVCSKLSIQKDKSTGNGLLFICKTCRNQKQKYTILTVDKKKDFNI